MIFNITFGSLHYVPHMYRDWLPTTQRSKVQKENKKIGNVYVRNEQIEKSAYVFNFFRTYTHEMNRKIEF